MSFQVMQPKIEVFRRAVLADPAVQSVGGYIGGGRGINNALDVRPAEAARRAQGPGADGRAAPAAEPPAGAGRPHVHVRRPGHPVRRRSTTAAATSTRCSPTTRSCCAPGARGSGARSQNVPELTGFDDELVSSQQVSLNVDRAEARRLGVDMNTVTQTLNNAFGQRQVSTIYNALNQYRVVMEVAPEQAQGPEALDRLYVISSTGQRVPLSAFSRYEHTAADDRVSHSGQFASTTISFDLKPGVSLSQAREAIDRAVDRLAMPVAVQGQLQGNARLFEADAGQPVARHSGNAAHRLHRARRAVRELHAPADHPLDAAVGRRRRVARAASRSTPSSASSRCSGSSCSSAS